jgi:DNA replication protein DnaC
MAVVTKPPNPHDNLTAAFPGALGAACDGDGWVTVTYPDRAAEARCPVCSEAFLIEAIREFLPPRFCAPMPLPPPVMDWARRGGIPGPQDGRKTGLMINGPVGTGKTHAAWLATAEWCASTGTWPRTGNVIVLRVTDLLDALRPQDDRTQVRVRDCQAADLLVLDDLGAEKPSEWAAERLYMIVDHRYVNCMPLIVTTNYPESRLAARLSGLPDGAPGQAVAGGPGTRIASRLAEMCTTVPMKGRDRRMGAA